MRGSSEVNSLCILMKNLLTFGTINLRNPKFYANRYIFYGRLCMYCLSLPRSIYSPLCGHDHRSHICKVQILQYTEFSVNAVFLELEAHVLFDISTFYLNGCLWVIRDRTKLVKSHYLSPTASHPFPVNVSLGVSKQLTVQNKNRRISHIVSLQNVR